MDVTAVVMGKLPAAGRVKTRLVPPLSFEQAADVHGIFLRHTLERLADAGLDVALCFDPPDAGGAMRERYAALSPKLSFHPQSGGDLGDRLVAAVETLGKESAVLFLGCDSPDVPEGHLCDALARLRIGADLVIGPCDDGGYWCLGVAAGVDLRPVVEGVKWSSGRELEQTRRNALAAGLSVADAPAWSDVDRPADLATLADRLRQDADPAAAKLLRLLNNALPGDVLQGQLE